MSSPLVEFEHESESDRPSLPSRLHVARDRGSKPGNVFEGSSLGHSGARWVSKAKARAAAQEIAEREAAAWAASAALAAAEERRAEEREAMSLAEAMKQRALSTLAKPAPPAPQVVIAPPPPPPAPPVAAPVEVPVDPEPVVAEPVEVDVEDYSPDYGTEYSTDYVDADEAEVEVVELDELPQAAKRQRKPRAPKEPKAAKAAKPKKGWREILLGAPKETAPAEDAADVEETVVSVGAQAKPSKRSKEPKAPKAAKPKKGWREILLGAPKESADHGSDVAEATDGHVMDLNDPALSPDFDPYAYTSAVEVELANEAPVAVDSTLDDEAQPEIVEPPKRRFGFGKKKVDESADDLEPEAEAEDEPEAEAATDEVAPAPMRLRSAPPVPEPRQVRKPAVVQPTIQLPGRSKRQGNNLAAAISGVLPAAPENERTPRSASEVAYEAATRPRGGARRAEGPAVVGTVGRDAAVRGRRIETGDAALLVSAADAADLLARTADNWDVYQILTHPEIAGLAADEAVDNILASGKMKSPDFEAMTLEERRTALLTAIDLLKRAHGEGLVGEG